MRSFLNFTALAILMLATPNPLVAQDVMNEIFESQPETRWRFFANTVMGGVSTGKVSFLSEGGISYARMTGRVSTANNGGFIQIRTDLATSPSPGTTGVRLMVRGNDQQYFVHLRTGGTILPWQYCQAGFEAISSWSELLPVSWTAT